MEITDLQTELANVTVEHLGSTADALDVTAYQEALRRAWMDRYSYATALVGAEAARGLGEAVLEGRAGRDAQGRDWVQVADSRRAK